jgi:hypothetical protein
MNKNGGEVMSEKSEGEVLGIREQVRNHLEYNISVPIPDAFLDVMTDVCVKGIEKVNEHDLEYKIPLSMGIKWMSVSTGIEYDYMPAYEAVRIYGLTQWLNSEWF